MTCYKLSLRKKVWLSCQTLNAGKYTCKLVSYVHHSLCKLSLRSRVWFSRQGRSQPSSTPTIQDGPTGVSLSLDCPELDPEGRVDTDVVWLWEGRCSPPAAGWRWREILLILRLHLCCILCLITVAFSHVLPWFPVPAAVSSSCLSRGCGMRTAGLLLWVQGDMFSFASVWLCDGPEAESFTRRGFHLSRSVRVEEKSCHCRWFSPVWLSILKESMVAAWGS